MSLQHLRSVLMGGPSGTNLDLPDCPLKLFPFEPQRQKLIWHPPRLAFRRYFSFCWGSKILCVMELETCWPNLKPAT